LTLLDGDWLNRMHGIECNASPLVAPAQEGGAVGKLSLRPYCAVEQTIAAIDAFRSLLERAISPHDIVALRVFAPPSYAEMIGPRDATLSRIGRITNVAYLLALAGYRPGELENIARLNFATEQQIAALMGRVEIVADKALEPFYLQRWPAGVEVVMKNGLRKMELVLDATGDPPRSSELNVRAKFHRLADSGLGEPAANILADACLHATESDEALALLCAKINS
jgi:2-methylcitrate dehydratase PrpD